MFEQEFEEMLRKYQVDIDDKKRFLGLVKDLFLDQAKNVNLLLMAYNMGIAQDMVNVARINNTFAYRYVKQLVDDYGMSRVNADWIVSIWCVCYGQNILGKPCDISLQKSGGKPAIEADTPSGGATKYGDLFTYNKSMVGNGLSVTGFQGIKSQTIIFQNRSGNNSVVEIGDSAFENGNIEEAIMTEGIKVVGKRSFWQCKLLHQVVFAATIKEIGDEAFGYCTSLKSISFPLALEKIGDRAFAGTGLRTVAFTKQIYWLGEGVFANCSEMDNVAITENITVLPKSIFEGCVSLRKVTLHDNLERIEDRAFFGCSSMDFMIIPDSVTYIGDNAFDGTDKQFIIQCSFGSYAEEYARKHKIKYQLV